MKRSDCSERKSKTGKRCVVPEKSWRENLELQSLSKVAIWKATQLSIFFLVVEKLSSFRPRKLSGSQRTVPAAPIQQRFRLALHPAWRWKRRSGEPRSLWLKQSRNIFDGRRLPEKSSTRLGICCDADNPVCAQKFAGKIGTVGVAVSFGVPRSRGPAPWQRSRLKAELRTSQTELPASQFFFPASQLQRFERSRRFRLFFAAASALAKNNFLPNNLGDKRLFMLRSTLRN